VPIYNLMEDAATAEICRAQVWQWVKHRAKLSGGAPVTAELVRKTVDEQARAEQAAQIFNQLTASAEFPEFLTLAAYDYID
jgi:malate synthase